MARHWQRIVVHAEPCRRRSSNLHAPLIYRRWSELSRRDPVRYTGLDRVFRSGFVGMGRICSTE
jgi:hypothetical protein